MISKIRFCDIKNSSFDFVILLNRFFDIKTSIFLYQEIHFLISQNRFCDITKYFVFVMSQNRGVYSKTAPHTIRRLGANG